MKRRIILVFGLFSGLYLISFAQGNEIYILNRNKASFPFRYHNDAFKILNNGYDGIFNSVYILSARRNGAKPHFKPGNKKPVDTNAEKPIRLNLKKAKRLPRQ